RLPERGEVPIVKLSPDAVTIERFWTLPALVMGASISIHALLGAIAISNWNYKNPSAEHIGDLAVASLFIAYIIFGMFIAFNKRHRNIILTALNSIFALSGTILYGWLIYMLIPMDDTRLYDTVPLIAYSAWTGFLTFAYFGVWVLKR